MAQKDRRLKKEGETFFGDYRRSATDCQYLRRFVAGARYVTRRIVKTAFWGCFFASLREALRWLRRRTPAGDRGSKRAIQLDDLIAVDRPAREMPRKDPGRPGDTALQPIESTEDCFYRRQLDACVYSRTPSCFAVRRTDADVSNGTGFHTTTHCLLAIVTDLKDLSSS